MPQAPGPQRVVGLDRSHRTPDNEAVWKRAGKRVHDWRHKQDPVVSQQSFARRAGVSVGCLQGFESGIRATQEKNIAKIAAVLGLTGQQLCDEDTTPLDRGHPLLKDCVEEDYYIAQRYHHAGAETKYAIKELFNFKVTDLLRQRLATLLVHVLRTPDILPHLEALQATFPASAPTADRDKKTS